MNLFFGLLALWVLAGLFFTLLILVVCLCEKIPIDWGVLVLPLFGPLTLMGLIAMVLTSNAWLDRSETAGGKDQHE